ncbi:MAG: DUF1080 domain-containing protein [Fimbriimonadaceae bacterium]|nr:DUF1080 domain-containing protein [Fimbriimonadaceae bacterium]
MRTLICLLLTSLPLAAQETRPGAELRVYDLGVGLARVADPAPGQLPSVHRVIQTVDLSDRGDDFGGLKENFLTVIVARLSVPRSGTYGLRLNSDDGGLLFLNDRLVIDHDGLHGATPKETSLYLYEGFYNLRVQQFEAGGDAAVKVSWRAPEAADWTTLGGNVLSVPADLRLEAVPGRKQLVPRVASSPGDAAPVAGLHPGWQRRDRRPAELTSGIVSLETLPDGGLLLVTRGTPGRVLKLAVDGSLSTVAPTAEALGAAVDGSLSTVAPTAEALGAVALDGRILLLTPRELLDVTTTPAGQVAAKEARERWLWVAGPVRLGGAVLAVSAPADTAGAPRGELWQVWPEARRLAADLPLPTALGVAGETLLLTIDPGVDAPGGELLAADAAGQWQPRRLAWLPAPVCQQPTQAVGLGSGPLATQLVVGDMAGGGLRRVIPDGPNAAVLQYSQGLAAGAARLLAQPDGGLLVGGDGGSAAWGELGKPGYGLEQLSPAARPVYELVGVRGQANGLTLRFSEALPPRAGWDPAEYTVTCWRPDPTQREPRRNVRRLPVASASVAGDSVFLEVAGWQPGELVQVRLPRSLRSAAGRQLWATEAWYTVNALPTTAGVVLAPPEGVQPNTLTSAEIAAGWRLLFDGETTKGWRGFQRQAFPASGWAVDGGTLHCSGSGGDLITADAFSNYEFALEWKIVAGGNSGVMYRVTEEVSPSFMSGPEIQVFDSPDDDQGVHAAGSLYDLLPAVGRSLQPAGEWNSLRFVLRGNHAEHWVNGVKVIEYEIGGPLWTEKVAASKFKDAPRFGTTPRGHLVLQEHGNEVWYRSLKIRELPAE